MANDEAGIKEVLNQLEDGGEKIEGRVKKRKKNKESFESSNRQVEGI